MLGSEEGRVNPLSFSFNILVFHSFPGAQAAPARIQGDELTPLSHPAPTSHGCRQSHALSGDLCLPQSGGQGTCSTGLVTCEILITAKAVGIESKLLGCHSLLSLHCASSLSSGSSWDRSWPGIAITPCPFCRSLSVATHGLCCFPFLTIPSGQMCQAVPRAPVLQDSSIPSVPTGILPTGDAESSRKVVSSPLQGRRGLVSHQCHT